MPFVMWTLVIEAIRKSLNQGEMNGWMAKGKTQKPSSGHSVFKLIFSKISGCKSHHSPTTPQLLNMNGGEFWFGLSGIRCSVRIHFIVCYLNRGPLSHPFLSLLPSQRTHLDLIMHILETPHIYTCDLF